MLHVAFRRPPRLVEYFVQVGLQEPLTPLLKEADRPITDLCLVYDREEAPDGFEKLEFTVSGGIGNLSAGGNVFSPAVWLCVSRGAHPLGPITDLAILYLDRDDGGKLPPGYTLLDADLNKGSYGYNIGLCYTRARLPGSHWGPILDIGIVNVARQDVVPPRYRVIGGARRNVNAGSFRDEICIVAKYAIRDPLQVKYKPAILDRFPRTEIPGSPMPTSIALFCCPDGIELVPSARGPPPATFASCVLTTDMSIEIYCACVTFYEKFEGDLPPVDDDVEEGKPTPRPAAVAAVTSSPSQIRRPRGFSAGSLSDLNVPTLLYAPRKICLLSYWPFFGNFCQYLEELYRHSRTTSRIPVERLMQQLWETPLPGSGKMRVQLEMGGNLSLVPSQPVVPHSHSGASAAGASGGRVIVFERPMSDDFPIANLPLILLFRTLSLSNILILLSAVLQEKKVIMASKVLPLLTYVGETVRTLIFPLKWTHPYIPILPAPLAGMLDAPMPIFVGVAEQFIDARVLSGDDIVIVYLDRDEIKVGGNGKEAYSTHNVNVVAAVNPVPIIAATINTALPSTTTTPAASSSTPSPSSLLPEKVPHLTLLPRRLLQRLVTELRAHTNVLRLKKFATHKDLESYFHCFRTSADEVDEEETTEESRSRSNSDIAGSAASTHPTSSASNALALRACFLHVFITLLGGLDAHLRFPSFEKGQTHTFAQLFDLASFLARTENKSRPFVRALVGTQLFSYYVEEKTDCSEPSRAIELAFFTHAQKYELEVEASIEAVRKMGGIVAHTAPELGVVLFLSQVGSNYTTFVVPPPDVTGLPETMYSYAEFPRRLDLSLIRESVVEPPPAQTSILTTISDTATNVADGPLTTSPEPIITEETITVSVSPTEPLQIEVVMPAKEGVVSASPSHAKSTTDLPAVSTAPAAAVSLGHIKSLSSGGVYVPPAYLTQPPNSLSQTSMPRLGAPVPNGVPRPAPRTSMVPPTHAALGTRMFTGARGPTTAFRPGQAQTQQQQSRSQPQSSRQLLPPPAQTQAQAPPPPEKKKKKDLFASFIDFITAVPQSTAPPPAPVPATKQQPLPTRGRRSLAPQFAPGSSTSAEGATQPRSTSFNRRQSAPPVQRRSEGMQSTHAFVGAAQFQSVESQAQFRAQAESRRSSGGFDPRRRSQTTSMYSDNIHIEPDQADARRTDISQTAPTRGTTRQ